MLKGSLLSFQNMGRGVKSVKTETLLLGARQQSVRNGENCRWSGSDCRPSAPPTLLVNHDEKGFGIIKTALQPTPERVSLLQSDAC
jgi:hypothetical protein